MNFTTFHDLWVGRILVKTCIIALVKLLFLKENKSIVDVVVYLGSLICKLS